MIPFFPGINGTLSEKPFMEIVGVINLDMGSHEMYNIAVKKTGYNLAVRRIETLSFIDAAHNLFLILLASNTTYLKRFLAAMQRAPARVSNPGRILA